jgi:hypothetical protein
MTKIGKQDGIVAEYNALRDLDPSRAATLEQASEAMGIGWMDWDELREAIPPVYTEHVGHQLMQHLNAGAASSEDPTPHKEKVSSECSLSRQS